MTPLEKQAQEETDESPRDYKALILESELLSSSSERVYQWLEARADKLASVKRTLGHDGSDLQLEKALLKRGDPLINLGLARFTIEGAIAQELFDRTQGKNEPANIALRLALLSNQVVARTSLNHFPHVLLGKWIGDDDAVAKWLGKAPLTELVPLFNNPTIDDSFLRDFLEGKESWQALSNDGRLTAVFALAKNPRMNEEYDGRMDGWAEYSHGAVFNAAWKLAETVPTTRIWVTALWELFNTLKRDAFSMENPLEVAKRWFPDSSDKKAEKDESSLHKTGMLGPYQTVRAHLADLAISKDHNLAEKLLSHDDIAYRAAAYRKADLTPERITAAYEKDKAVGITSAIHNENLWRSDKTRSALNRTAWRASKEDEHSDLDIPNAYRWMEEAMERKHPKWFAENSDSEPLDEPATSGDIKKFVDAFKVGTRDADKPATKADIQKVVETVGAHGEQTEPILPILRQVNVSLLGLNKTLGWVWWFSLGALATLLWHRG